MLLLLVANIGIWLVLLSAFCDATGNSSCSSWLASNYCNVNLHQAAIFAPSATLCPDAGCSSATCCSLFRAHMRIKGPRGHLVLGDDGAGNDYASIGRRGSDLLLRTTNANGTIIVGNSVQVNGKMGIGTESPEVALDVAGNCHCSGTVQASSVSALPYEGATLKRSVRDGSLIATAVKQLAGLAPAMVRTTWASTCREVLSGSCSDGDVTAYDFNFTPMSTKSTISLKLSLHVGMSVSSSAYGYCLARLKRGSNVTLLPEQSRYSRASSTTQLKNDAQTMTFVYSYHNNQNSTPESWEIELKQQPGGTTPDCRVNNWGKGGYWSMKEYAGHLPL